ncbi:MAG: Rab family GTPase [Candidatus Hodarchaeales archaeon]|jgi:small GTP-binding protein
MKIVLLGDGAVGKTALRLRFMGLGFQSRYMMTIGADFAIKTINITSGPYAGNNIKSQIWDLAGQLNFNKVRALYYNGSHAALMVYDCTRLDTFQNIENWMGELFKNTRTIIPVVLIANKTDLRANVDFSLTKEDGLKMAQAITDRFLQNKVAVPYFETSALTGENVDFAFQSLAEQVIKFFS